MKVLITGATGFIGSRLIESVSAEFGSENVVVLSSKPHPNYTTVVYSEKFTLGNNAHLIEDVSLIIHAGAFIPKSRVDADNVALCSGNIAFTNMLLKANYRNLQKIVYLSTVDVYGQSETIDEDTLVSPVSLYGESKLYCEKMVKAYSVNLNIKSQILRIGHVYGPGEEKYQKLLPIAIQKMLNKKELELWGTGEELRSFIYIDDVVKACLAAVKLNDYVGIINVCGSQSISIYNLLVKISEIIDCELTLIKQAMPGEARNLVFNNSKMLKYLISKETSFEVGLSEEIKYLKDKL